MALLINKDRLESPLKNMSRTFMVSVKKLGIDTVDLSHAEGEIGIRCLDQQMVVVVHETVGMAEQVVLPDSRTKDGKELLPISIIHIDLSPRITAGGDMIDSTRVFNSERTCHDNTYSRS
jgi:phosphopantetheine adenylyltransferase